MYLHECPEEFQQLVLAASSHSGISAPIIEKDYYVTMFLREITKITPDIVFKGGTSLSKGYGLIQRFSEDIDLNYDNGQNKPTVSMRKSLKNAIVEGGNKLCLIYQGDQTAQIPYKRDFLEYDYAYRSLFSITSLRPVVKIETSVRTPSFPLEEKWIASELQKYLEITNDKDSIQMFELSPFPVKVQSLERTFADKLYAVADYFLENMADRDSRHLYDLYCMASYINIDQVFVQFLKEIRKLRQLQPNNPAAISGRSLTDILQEALDSDFYMADYERYTIPLLFEPVDYQTAKNVVQKVIDHIRELMSVTTN